MAADKLVQKSLIIREKNPQHNQQTKKKQKHPTNKTTTENTTSRKHTQFISSLIVCQPLHIDNLVMHMLVEKACLKDLLLM